MDNDHSWFTTGVSMSYMFNESVSGSLGYSTEIDSDYDSEIVSVGLTVAF